MERRLRELPLAAPQLPLAGEQPVPEQGAQALGPAPLGVIDGVLLEHVLHVVRVQDEMSHERAEPVANDVAVRGHVARMDVEARLGPERRQVAEERVAVRARSDVVREVHAPVHLAQRIPARRLDQREIGSRLRPAPPLRSMSGPASSARFAITSTSFSAMAMNDCDTELSGAACTTGVPLSPHSRTV